MELKAKTNFLRMSPRKVRLVIDLTKGLDVEEALTQLKFLKKRATGPVEKLIRSAISNAEENFNLKRGNLYIKEIRVDGGPTIHRFMPRAMGRATPIRKRTSHLSLILAERVPTEPGKIKKAKPKEDQKDDIIKVDDLKEFEVKEKAEAKKEGKKPNERQDKKAKKGFTKRFFNRKSG